MGKGGGAIFFSEYRLGKCIFPCLGLCISMSIFKLSMKYKLKHVILLTYELAYLSLNALTKFRIATDPYFDWQLLGKTLGLNCTTFRFRFFIM